MQEKSEQRMVDKLEQLIERNTKSLQELVKPFEMYSRVDPRGKGLLGMPRDFRAECFTLNRAVAKYQYDKASWDDINGYHAELLISSNKGASSHLSIREEFELLINRALTDHNVQQSTQTRLEKAAINYLRYLELRDECFQQWVKALKRQQNIADSENTEEFEDFKANYKIMKAYVKELNAEIEEFKRKLTGFAVNYGETYWCHLPNTRPINLKITLSELNISYIHAYKETNPFWRWIKYLFQRSERALEIQFLETVSNHPSCTDAIRIEAIKLVHNKIVTSEIFGAGSKLKSILGDLGEQAVEEDNNGVSLRDLIEKASELEQIMPKGLRDYYTDRKSICVNF